MVPFSFKAFLMTTKANQIPTINYELYPHDLPKKAEHYLNALQVVFEIDKECGALTIVFMVYGYVILSKVVHEKRFTHSEGIDFNVLHPEMVHRFETEIRNKILELECFRLFMNGHFNRMH